MANIIYIAASLDGYIARENGSLDWLFELPNPENSDYGFVVFLKRIDGISMGRKTFETVLGFPEWPYTKPVFVWSGTLKDVPERLCKKVEIVSGGLKGILTALNARGMGALYVDGGRTVRTLLQEDRADELIISRVPIVLGAGIPLFPAQGLESRFRHLATEAFSNGIVKSSYIRDRVEGHKQSSGGLKV